MSQQRGEGSRISGCRHLCRPHLAVNNSYQVPIAALCSIGTSGDARSASKERKNTCIQIASSRVSWDPWKSGATRTLPSASPTPRFKFDPIEKFRTALVQFQRRGADSIRKQRQVAGGAASSISPFPCPLSLPIDKPTDPSSVAAGRVSFLTRFPH